MTPRLTLLMLVLTAATGSSHACAARSGRAAADGATALTQRVEAYWKRREAKDLIGAYAFYCSAYKNRVSQAEFLGLTRLTRVDILDTRVQVSTESGSRVEVAIALRFVMPRIAPEPLESQTTEWWARDADGQWCKEDEPLVLPFPRSPRRASTR